MEQNSQRSTLSTEFSRGIFLRNSAPGCTMLGAIYHLARANLLRAYATSSLRWNDVSECLKVPTLSCLLMNFNQFATSLHEIYQSLLFSYIITTNIGCEESEDCPSSTKSHHSRLNFISDLINHVDCPVCIYLLGFN